MLFLPSTRKWFLLSLALIVLGLVVISTDFFNNTDLRVFFILWGTLPATFHMIGFLEWAYYNSPQGKTVPFNLWSQLTSNIWIILGLVLLIFGATVTTLDNFGDIDIFNDIGRKIFFGFLIVAFYVMIFFTWRKMRSRLQYEKETIHVSYTKANSPFQPASVITPSVEKKRNTPNQGQRARPVITRTKR